MHSVGELKIKLVHSVSDELMRSTVMDYCHNAASERRLLKLTHAWQLRTVTDKGRLLTDSTDLHTVVEVASGKGQT